MKIGQLATNPRTGDKGRIVGFRNGQAIARNAEGELFVGQSARGRKKQAYRVRVLDDGLPFTDWLDAVRQHGDYFLIVALDAVWHGAVIGRDELEVEVGGHEAGTTGGKG